MRVPLNISGEKDEKASATHPQLQEFLVRAAGGVDEAAVGAVLLPQRVEAA
jgi:hypothetical protein